MSGERIFDRPICGSKVPYPSKEIKIYVEHYKNKFVVYISFSIHYDQKGDDSQLFKGLGNHTLKHW